MARFRENIPNAITLAALMCGCLACIMALNGSVMQAACFIFAAGFFDFSDGLVARALKANSLIGKELDSLSDLVCFGLAPSFIIYHYLVPALEKHPEIPNWVQYSFLIMPVCAAIRLARFNIEESENASFIGLPSPASAIAICSIPLWNFQTHHQTWLTQNPIVLILITVILSVLMVSKVKMLSLKFSNLNWKGNQVRYLLIGFSLISLILGALSIPFIILIYFLLSLTQNRIQ